MIKKLTALFVGLGCMLFAMSAGLAAVAVARGCHVESRADIAHKVRLGMTRQEVLDILGEPGTSQNLNGVYSNSEYWYYWAYDGQVQVCLTNGRVDFVNRY